MKAIYTPKGRAKEYGDYCVNIYTGCPHRCYYCFAPSVLRREKEVFHASVEPRAGIVEAVKKQIKNESISGKLIHLCFTCDPYPNGYDASATREIITALKGAGNNVQILTKGDGTRDFDLLGENDWYGVSITGAMAEQERGAVRPSARLTSLAIAKNRGIKTWVSFEPVIDDDYVLAFLSAHAEIFDKVKIGKLNYYPSDINWGEFGRRVEERCKALNLDYYIKKDLRAEMEEG